uniref:Putative secreted protein n=1 Tax=Anopheles marajoara TaxID=58244 RepID=A0A2M4C5W5_9DIPT
MNSKNVSRSSSPRMPSSSVFITLLACSCSSSEVACSSFVFSSRNLENMFNRSACSSNSLMNMVMPVVSIARLMPFQDATIVYFCLAVSGNRASVGGGPHASRLGTLLLFELLPLLPLANFVNSQPMFPPRFISTFFGSAARLPSTLRGSLTISAFLDYAIPSFLSCLSRFIRVLQPVVQWIKNTKDTRTCFPAFEQTQTRAHTHTQEQQQQQQQ